MPAKTKCEKAREIFDRCGYVRKRSRVRTRPGKGTCVENELDIRLNVRDEEEKELLSSFGGHIECYNSKDREKPRVRWVFHSKEARKFLEWIGYEDCK